MKSVTKTLYKPIDGFGSKYFVSDDGHIYSIRRRGQIGGVMSETPNSSGYLRVNLSSDGKTKSYFIHRIVAAAFVQNPDSKEFVNHKDGNKKNNCADNLEWCTRRENMAHAMSHGLIHYAPMRGDKHPMCKISDADAKEIIRLRKSGVLSHELAEKYGVTCNTIRNIVYGRRKFNTEQGCDET